MIHEGDLRALADTLVSHFSPLLESINRESALSKAVFVYDRGQPTIVPPVLGVLTVEHEAAMRDSMEGDDLAESLWNPEEFSEYATLELTPEFNKEASRLFENINTAVRTNRADEASVVIAVAEACEILTTKLSTTTLAVKPIVYATDAELADLRHNIEYLRSRNRNFPNDVPTWCR